MSDAQITIVSNGQLSRRARNFIQYAPTGMSITVKQTDNRLAGYSINSVIIDDPIAELTSSVAADGEAKGGKGN